MKVRTVAILSSTLLLVNSALLLCFVAVAMAQPMDAGVVDAGAAVAADAGASDPETVSVDTTGLGGILERGYEAVTEGNGKHVVAAVVLLLVFLLRKWKWLREAIRDAVGDDRGGVLLAMFTAFGGAVAHTIFGGGDLTSWTPWTTALQIMVEAIGGYVGLKKLLKPKE